MTFKLFLKEQEEYLDDIPQGNIPVSLFIGRFQPFHLGHLKAIRDILRYYPNQKVLIGVVRGDKTSQDKQKNPFPFDVQLRLIRESTTEVRDKIIILDKPLKSGYVPEAVKQLRKKDYEVRIVAASGDRVDDYERQINNLKNLNKTVNIQFIKTKRYGTASDVRQALIDNDKPKFERLTSPGIWEYFNDLQSMIVPDKKPEPDNME